MAPMLEAEPVEIDSVEDAERIVEGLDLAEEALANLARLSGHDEDDFRDGDGWAARVILEGVPVIVLGNEVRWQMVVPPGTDEADATRAARRLHGLLGEQSEGWDLDR